MEHASLSEKILRSINKIIKNDSEIEDFAIVATDDNSMNKSPVLYENHHLGLESWCIKYVYDYAGSKLIEVRSSLAEGKLPNSLREDVNYLLVGSLLINPDVTTYWNMKRELMECGVLNYETELLFSKLVLTKKPKSNEAFAYRRWLISPIIKENAGGFGPISLERVLDLELAICTQTASSTPNNYHSWTHREWCLKQFLPHLPRRILEELEFSEQWINTHVSEYSGYYYRQTVLDCVWYLKYLKLPKEYFFRIATKYQLKDLLDASPLLNLANCDYLLEFLFGNISKPKEHRHYVGYLLLLLYELDIISYIDKEYIEHESLWLHRRSVVYKLLHTSQECLGSQVNVCKKIVALESLSSSSGNIIATICNHSSYGEKQAKIFKSQASEFEATPLYKMLCDSERDFIMRNSLRSSLQSEYAKRYEKWLKYVAGFTIVL